MIRPSSSSAMGGQELRARPARIIGRRGRADFDGRLFMLREFRDFLMCASEIPLAARHCPMCTQPQPAQPPSAGA